ncbi:MAG: S8 family serine peptidase [Bacteroidales bacterium]|nr:S8 family serine peptidase [Bacteroidales bacterium]
MTSAERIKKVLIVVIDSGIDTSVSDLNNYVFKSTGYRVNEEGYIAEFPEIKNSEIHGSAISLIIREYCKNVELISINILNEKLTTDSRVMIYAMNEALKLNPHIIHMSMGTTKRKYRKYIQEIVTEAKEKNIMVVAACNNMGFKSYPAFIDGVIGVKSVKCSETTNSSFYKKNRFDLCPLTDV